MLNCDALFIPVVKAFVDSPVDSSAEQLEHTIGEAGSYLLVATQIDDRWV